MDENVKFVHKEINPPSAAQARPIKNFRECLAPKVYAVGWKAETEQQLICRIES